jgi:RNA polymerase sigma-70 factor (ECF subfamily)
MSVDARVAELLGQDRGDEAATAVIEAYGREVLSYLQAVLRDVDQAGDAFSVWVEHVWRGLPGFRGEAPLRVWCYRVASRAAQSCFRDAYGRRKDRFDTSMASRLAGKIFQSTLLEQERRSSALERLRAALDPEEQALLTLRVDRQMSWHDIAEVLAGEADGDRPAEPALRKRFERLKAKLARAARDEGLVS